jgi:hypothetical protein
MDANNGNGEELGKSTRIILLYSLKAGNQRMLLKEQLETATSSHVLLHLQLIQKESRNFLKQLFQMLLGATF